MWILIIIIIIGAVIYWMTRPSNEVCKYCGKPMKNYQKVTLKDGTVICSDCRTIPEYMKETFENWTYEDFQNFKEYEAISKDEYTKQFSPTVSYGKLFLDEKHGLICIDDKYKPGESLLLSAAMIESFIYDFIAKEANSGILHTEVIGDVVVAAVCQYPFFAALIKVKKDVKAPAKKKGIINKKIEYEMPEELQFFMLRMEACVRNEKERLRNQLERESLNEISDVNKAMALFMFDTLDGVTLSDLKIQRDRLIKTFHPDSGVDIDPGFAQKINVAYDALKEEIKKRE